MFLFGNLKSAASNLTIGSSKRAISETSLKEYTGCLKKTGTCLNNYAFAEVRISLLITLVG